MPNGSLQTILKYNLGLSPVPSRLVEVSEEMFSMNDNDLIYAYDSVIAQQSSEYLALRDLKP